MSDPVPAIAEAAAIGETATIFADIREVLGVDVVNLIWRHLAVIPGALQLAWGMLRPLYADGTIVTAAIALHRDLDLPLLPPLPGEALVAVDVGAGEVAGIRDILAAYDRTNAMALVALAALSLPPWQGARCRAADRAGQYEHAPRASRADSATALAEHRGTASGGCQSGHAAESDGNAA